MARIVAVEDWSSVTHAGAFVFGLLVGIVMTIRLAKAIAAFLRRERDRDE